MLRNRGLSGWKQEILILFQKWVSIAHIFVVFDVGITEASLVQESRWHEKTENKNLTGGPR